ncbi:hypothetical protein QWZ10_20600 [Paracoccus cavernae]|uniref:Uncharacterized protein n=1 Tax=Paracoccus cavernae TaxID=1571207 RepID=A0ABT8D9S7_9RHOB|nr:hypothetical protein [Paracoccus cavernae]MDN3713539.1 hypothetical protein [Paracoccus cavernae]
MKTVMDKSHKCYAGPEAGNFAERAAEWVDLGTWRGSRGWKSTHPRVSLHLAGP